MNPRYKIVEEINRTKKRKFQSQFHKKYEQLQLYSSADVTLARELLKIDMAEEYYNQQVEKRKQELHHKNIIRKVIIKKQPKIEQIEIVSYNKELQSGISLWKSK
ncbi:Hypothetical_protein [Hexamita inflata]|uniref:Hypothetical_protein n=1 Tax=Hexamita inflata TaxID=28002 RepID=A0ABP1HJH2_9EUKA